MEGTFFYRIIFFCSPPDHHNCIEQFQNEQAPNMIKNVQAYNLSKTDSEKCFKMYYLLKRAFVLMVMTANQF